MLAIDMCCANPSTSPAQQPKPSKISHTGYLLGHMDNADLVPVLILTILLVALSRVLLMGNYFSGLTMISYDDDDELNGDDDDDVWIRPGLNPLLTPPLDVPRSENVGLEPITKDQPYFEKLSSPMQGEMLDQKIAHSIFANQFLFTYHNALMQQNVLLECHRYVAKGGYARVFMATELLKGGGKGKTLAVKIPFKENDTEMIRLEARHKAGNSWIDGAMHPNVVTICGWSNNTADEHGQSFLATGLRDLAPYGFIVLEFAQLGDIMDNFIDAKGMRVAQPFSEPYLKRLARDLFRGLSFMHNHGITHRDIKNENLIIDCFGNVKIADWGLILPSKSKKARNEENSYSRTARRGCGTIMYMAPEMTEEIELISRRINPNEYCDVWSCGVTLLLAGTACPPSQVFLGGADCRSQNFAEQCVDTEKVRRLRNKSGIPPYFKTWWNSWLQKGDYQGDFQPMSPLQENFFQQIFRIQFPSDRNKTTGDHLRASAIDLLNHNWLQTGVATEKEWAEMLVSRNYESCLEALNSSPKHSKLLTTASKDNVIFFASLVGFVYKKKYARVRLNEQPATDFLKSLGLEKMSGVTTFGSADTWLNSSEHLLDVSEQRLLARALDALNIPSQWKTDHLG
jgi:serine/threonine protein kinase